VEAAKFYVSNNCQAVGGIKCRGSGEGAQQIQLPNVIKALTPPKNGGKIVREKRLPPPSVQQAADEEDE